ncbi:MAG: V-type ATP synthase subunit A [Candidatus Promineifilaceae bacterium]|nr:V-type ATP synthase subunit A [Candidatus Promineifilaceae bacterium]
MSDDAVGSLYWISGPVVRAHINGQLSMAEQTWVGEERLASEVISVSQDQVTVQVYEKTQGLHVGERLFGSGQPLSVTLGPGLIGSTFDGIQRPLEMIRERTGNFIRRGERVSPLNTERKWPFAPQAEAGAEVEPGTVLGLVSETPLVEHKILVPPGVHGTLKHLAGEGDYTVEEEIAVVQDRQGKERSLTMLQRWPVRQGRPIVERREPTVPLITGQRVIDTLFPIAKGGTAAIPGGFGTGKTVTLHSLAKWSDADIVVYVGCGERGNEMTQVLEEFPELEDPWTGHPLMERTILIANTSNMPVAARESSIYTGLTIAEYYRDQGFDVALMADSTSRWAQALREISGRLGEMPAEEGYPAYLASRLAAFYERAGRVTVLGGEDEGSVTVMGAVSPPGGDFSEPVTRHTQRFTRCFWTLDRDLAHQRHYPAISWRQSYSLYLEQLAEWWRERVEEDWQVLRTAALGILQRQSDLQQIVQLVGPEALADKEQWTLDVARLLREGFLDQNAFHPVDAYTVPEKQIALLNLFMWLHDRGNDLLELGLSIARLREEIDMPHLIRLKEQVPNDEPEQIEDVRQEVGRQLERARDEYRE